MIDQKNRTLPGQAASQNPIVEMTKGHNTMNTDCDSTDTVSLKQVLRTDLNTISISGSTNLTAKQNIEEARQFLQALGGPTEFRTFSDRDKSKKGLNRTIPGNFEDLEQQLVDLNDRGAGVFVVVNEGGQTDDAISKVRAVFADFDGTDIPESFALPPSITIQSSTDNKVHVYWLVDGDFPLTSFTPMQQTIALKYGSDMVVSNLSRVMRIPGFLHQKGDPILSKLINLNETLRYTHDQLMEAFEADVTGHSEPKSQHHRRPIGARAKCGRNTLLTSYAGGLRSKGADFESILAALLVKNKSDCSPPLDDSEVEGIAKSVAKYKVDFEVSESSIIAAGQVRESAIFTIMSVLKQANIQHEQYQTLVESAIYLLPIANGIESAFWQPDKSKIFLFSAKDSGDLLQCTAADFPLFCNKAFQSPCNTEVLNTIIKATAVTAKDAKLICQATHNALLSHLKFFNQRTTLEYRVDPFANTGKMELMDEHVRVIFTHKPFPEFAVDETVIMDYKEHFPELDEVLDFICYSRFAGDRKHSYLWLWADSDWGKGLFIGALDKIHANIGLSVKEIEAFFEGKPVGRCATDFKRPWVASIDEFKSVKSELKQLQSEITLAPKHQLTCKVEVFTKLFLSAESVESLVGSHGVEDQFCNRMSIIRGKHSILTRSNFIEVGSTKYCESLAGYIARHFNKKAEELVAMGRDQACKESGGQLAGFHSKYGIGKQFGRLSEAVDEIAAEILEYMIKYKEQGSPYPGRKSITSRIELYQGHLLLTAPTKLIDDWIEENVPHSEKVTIKRKKSEILNAMSLLEDWQTKSYKVGNETLRGMLLKATDGNAGKLITKLSIRPKPGKESIETINEKNLALIQEGVKIKLKKKLLDDEQKEIERKEKLKPKAAKES